MSPGLCILVWNADSALEIQALNRIQTLPCLESSQREIESFLQTQLPTRGHLKKPSNRPLVQRSPWSKAPPGSDTEVLVVFTPLPHQTGNTCKPEHIVPWWWCGGQCRWNPGWGQAAGGATPATSVLLRSSNIQGTLGATGSPPSFAGSETKTYLGLSCPPAGDKKVWEEAALGIVWISRGQIFHRPLWEDSQAAVVYVALPFRKEAYGRGMEVGSAAPSMAVAAFPYINMAS